MPSQTRLKLIALVTAGFLASAACAHARDFAGFYMGGYHGLKLPESNFAASAPQKETAFAGALGFHLSPHWRMEGEVSSRRDDFTGVNFQNNDSLPLSDKMKSWAGLVNFYYDFGKGGKFQPFLGAGAGYVTSFSQDHDDGGFAWQAGVGLNYDASPNITFASAYRYLDSPTSAYESVLGGHEVHIGMKYKLPYKPPGDATSRSILNDSIK